MKKNIVLADCVEEEIVNLIKGLETSTNKTFFCESLIACGIRTGIMSELKRYYKYFYAAWRTYKNRDKYEIIIGWQQFYGLIFSFYSTLFRTKKKNTLVVLNYTYKEKKGIFGKIYKGFMKKCLNDKYIDYIHVLSHEYADLISKTFNFPRKKIIVSGFGVDDIYLNWKDSQVPLNYIKNGYALSIGRSNRDFDFLIKAWENLNFPLVIISDTYNGNSFNKNINIIKNVSGDLQYPWMINAKMVIIPIDDGRICSGDTVLLTSLSFEKNVIVTSPSTLGEMYIENGKNGFLIEKNREKFVSLIKKILSNSEIECGVKARKSYLENYSREAMGKRIGRYINNLN